MIEWGILLICGWLGATVSGAAGFGGALLLLPILAFTVGGKAAVPGPHLQCRSGPGKHRRCTALC